MPHDTPVDTPAVGVVGDIIERPQLGFDPAAASARALAAARSVETLEALYLAWGELNATWSSAKRRWADEEKRLVTQGELLLGAMRAASGAQAGATPGLVNVSQLTSEAETRLREVRERFAAETQRATVTFGQELERVRTELLEAVRRRAAVSRPAFRLSVRVVGEQRILHLSRLSDDDAVVALFALTGRVPSRYGYLADDSLDDLREGPAPLYADEGVTVVRPDATAFKSLLAERSQMWPVKGNLPLALGETWLRWAARGAVLEAEIEEQGGWRNLLRQSEAEQLTGLLLAFKLAGKIELELVRD